MFGFELRHQEHKHIGILRKCGTMSIHFYNQNADEFYESTKSIDASMLYEHFLAYIPNSGKILDAGCGSGRDAAYFTKHGYEVEAFDGSHELAKRAKAHAKIEVQVCDFNSFQSESSFDGIWACASLLHVPYKELARTIEYLAGNLNKDGIFYCSFKYGTEEGIRGGRYFTNLDEGRAGTLMREASMIIDKYWITSDLREGRESEKWLNLILKNN